jgi:hypothetical protein
MKWIGQHIYDLVSKFRNDVYLESVSTGTIASGGNLGLDSNNKIVKATISSGSGDITGVTITTDSGGGSAASDIAGSADFSILGANGVGVTNSGTTITAAAVPGEIDHDSLNNFVANEHIDWTGASAGTIHASNYTDTNTNQLTEFTLTGDSGSNQTIAHGNTLDIAGGNAISTVVGATDTVTINHDDTSSQASVDNSGSTYIQDVTLDTYGHVTGLTSTAIPTLNQDTTGNADTATALATSRNLQVDLTSTSAQGFTGAANATSIGVNGVLPVANTAAKVTSIVEGEGIDISAATGDVRISGEDATTSNKGIASFSSDNFAVSSGAVTIKDEGVDLTAEVGGVLPSANQKHLAWFEIAGIATGDGTNYEISVNLDNDDAPWLHNVSTGSAGTTAITVQNIMRSGGTVAPRAGTLKRWTGWATTAGSSTANIALFKITPTRNISSDVAPVLMHNFSYTALGNAKAEDWDETSFTDADLAAGDIIVSGVKSQNNKSTYFTSTVEIEWD